MRTVASAFGNDERIKYIRPLFFSSSSNAIAGNPNPLTRLRFPRVSSAHRTLYKKLYKINDNVRSRLDIYSLGKERWFFRAFNSPIRLYATRRSSINDNESPFDSLISLWITSFF